MKHLSSEGLILCPCGSNLSYENCCGLYHKGKQAENALILMKSRYSAYALHQTDYIIATTHPKSLLYLRNYWRWKEQIQHFSTLTKFLRLEIIDHHLGEVESYVTFIAHLKQGEADASFKEKSRFLLEHSKWFYFEGNHS